MIKKFTLLLVLAFVAIIPKLSAEEAKIIQTQLASAELNAVIPADWSGGSTGVKLPTLKAGDELVFTFHESIGSGCQIQLQWGGGGCPTDDLTPGITTYTHIITEEQLSQFSGQDLIISGKGGYTVDSYIAKSYGTEYVINNTETTIGNWAQMIMIDKSFFKGCIAGDCIKFYLKSIDNPDGKESHIMLQNGNYNESDPKIGLNIWNLQDDPTNLTRSIELDATSLSAIELTGGLNVAGYYYTVSKIAIKKTGIVLNENWTPDLSTYPSLKDIKLQRTITKDKWSTIVLPFAMTSEQLTSTFGAGVSVAELQNTSTADELIFSTVSATEANKPYAIKVASDFSSATIPNVTIVSATPTQSLTNWNFVGNYTTGIYIPVNSYYFSDNKLKKSTIENNHLIKPFRAYFTYKDGSPSLSRGFTIDGQTTGINATILENDEFSDGKIYNLNGQQIAQPSKGLYIKNGKKYIIK